MLEAALQGRDRVTLDIDASVVHAKKKTACTYRGKRGYTPMTGQVVRHAWQWVLKAGPSSLDLLEEMLWRMRTCRLP